MKRLKVLVKTLALALCLVAAAVFIGACDFSAKDGSKVCIVTINSDGGDLVPQILVRYGNKIEEIPSVTRAGYEFSGWYLGGEIWDFDNDTVKKDVTLKARWKAVDYSVSYILNGGENASGNPDKYTTETSGVVLKSPTKKGFDFIGWTYEGQIAPEYDAKIAVGSIGNKTFTAVWQEKIFTYLDHTITSLNQIAKQNSIIFVPSRLDGEEITAIADGVFRDCNNIKSIILSNSLEDIGSSTFHGCWRLTSINIPTGVTSIGDATFSGCSSLTSITIPNDVTSIGDKAFFGCSSLTSLTIPDSVKSIGEEAFSGCGKLMSVVIPNDVTSLGYSLFSGCSSLASITIPDSVTSIGERAFYSCSSLKSINIPSSVISIGNWAFYFCVNLTSVTIPDSVTSIGIWTFRDCYSLSSIIIPDSVTSIGIGMFYNCSNLASLTFEGTKAQWGVVSLGSDWNYNTGNYVVHCTDGDITK